MFDYEEMSNEELFSAQSQLWEALIERLSQKNLQNVRELIEIDRELTKRES